MENVNLLNRLITFQRALPHMPADKLLERAEIDNVYGIPQKKPEARAFNEEERSFFKTFAPRGNHLSGLDLVKEVATEITKG